MDVADVIVTFFKTPDWDFHPLFHTGEEIKEQGVCIQKNLMSRTPLVLPTHALLWGARFALHSGLLSRSLLGRVN